MQVIGVSQIEPIEERFLLELRQRKEENISDYARRVGTFKPLALKKFNDEHWASNCLSGLNDECLRNAVKDHAQITMIVRELERQGCLEHQLNVLWTKMHLVRRRHAEPLAQEEKSPTDNRHFGVAKIVKVFRNLGSCRKRSRRETLLTWTVPMMPNAKRTDSIRKHCAHKRWTCGEVNRSMESVLLWTLRQ